MDAGVVHQDDELTLDVPEEMSAKRHHLCASNGSWVGLLQELARGRDGAEGGKLVPTGSGRDDRRLSSNSPGAGHRRFQTEATFIEEDESHALLDLFFPTQGACARPKSESPAHRVPGHAVPASED